MSSLTELSDCEWRWLPSWAESGGCLGETSRGAGRTAHSCSSCRGSTVERKEEEEEEEKLERERERERERDRERGGQQGERPRRAAATAPRS